MDAENNKDNNDYAEDYKDLDDNLSGNIYDDESLPKDEEYNPFIKKFEYFLNSYYKKELDYLIQVYPSKKSLLIDFELIEQYDPSLADELIANPEYIIGNIHSAAKNYESILLEEKKDFDPVIRISNLPKDKRIMIKHISSDHLGKFICVEGLVKQFTTVLPKLKKAHFICQKCGFELNLHQESLDLVKPKICPECKHRVFTLDEINSEFIDYQKLEIQDLLENLRGGEQSSTINVYVQGDLVNSFTAGERLIISGILKLRTPPEVKQTVFSQYILSSSIESSKQDFETIEITKEDEEKLKELSNNPEIYNMLVDSIAPHINGHQEIKLAVALQLFGGVRKTLDNQSKIRGNLHILLVGDPGVGKSQILKAAEKIAPKSIYIVGKTASGAGLTATAVKDEFGEGGWTLKAGALVLANGGFAMVDEFDKMDPEDRSAMHEALEQETVSIAKAGMVTSFKTETSVLAAANPKYGRFDSHKDVPSQIDIPPTLMSRFDLFFVLQDIVDNVKDKETIDSILRAHKTGALLQKQKDSQLNEREKTSLDKINIISSLDQELLRKYISYARTRVFPVLSDVGSEMLQKFFLSLRQKSQDGRVTVTYRQLEALIRLAEASARVRLSEKVLEEDIERAIGLYKKSMEQVGMDPETGEMDIDLITSGRSHSQNQRHLKIMEIITKLNAITDYEKGVPMDLILEHCESEGIDKLKAKEIIRKLINTGELYEPRNGFIKVPNST